MSREKMLDVLRNNKTRQIAFSFRSSVGGTVSVNHNTFDRVINGLVNSHFDVTNVGVPQGGAAYNGRRTETAQSGTFRINPGKGGPAFESLVVHESVHASFDVTRSVLPWVDNEAAAHIAQGYYYLLSNISVNAITFEPVRQGFLLASYLHDTGFVSAANLEGLRNALLRAEPYQRYIHTTSQGDG